MSFSVQDIALVTVTYQSAHMADFFAETGRLFKHVFVVDNHSQDGTTQAFASVLPHAQIIALPQNIGFGPANNTGFAAASKHCAQVLFLNPDCKISLDSIRLLQDSLQAQPQTAISCPVIVNDQGQHQGVARRNYKLGYRHEVVETLDPSATLPEHLPDTCIAGSCLLVDATKFNIIGAFNPSLFMYYEEDDLSLRCAAHHFGVVTNTRARAIHLVGKSSPPTVRILLRKAYHYRWSRLYMLGTHSGTSHRLRVALKTLFLAPAALLLYALLLQKSHGLKWLGWLAASLDALTGSQFFRRIL